tara:strand:- start:43163 stop:43339 length:177 start_codon:yes stop_codon:yes gene_type:complete
MIKIENERQNYRNRELFLGHLVIWGSIIGALVLAISLTYFSAPEKEESASVARAEAAS